MGSGGTAWMEDTELSSLSTCTQGTVSGLEELAGCSDKTGPSQLIARVLQTTNKKVKEPDN